MVSREECWSAFKKLEAEFGLLSNIIQNDVPISEEEQAEWNKRVLYFKSGLADFVIMISGYIQERKI